MPRHRYQADMVVVTRVLVENRVTGPSLFGLSMAWATRLPEGRAGSGAAWQSAVLDHESGPRSPKWGCRFSRKAATPSAKSAPVTISSKSVCERMMAGTASPCRSE